MRRTLPETAGDEEQESMETSAKLEKQVRAEEIWQLLKQKPIPEILKADHRTEVLYALSEEQKNLLDWYPFEKGKTLLECRGGYGTLTELFLQKDLKVTTVVESATQRRVIEKRCGKNGNALTIDLAEEFRKREALINNSFDYVVLADAASEEELEVAWGYVNPGGSLFAAADNRRSLLQICSGNATGNRGVALADCEALAEKQRVKGAEIYFPIPGWRLPKVVYSEEYLVNKQAPEFPMAYYEPPECLIHEAEAFRELLKMGQYRDLARSYLLIWEKA